MRRPVNPGSRYAPVLRSLRRCSLRLVVQHSSESDEAVLLQRFCESVSDIPLGPDVDQLHSSVAAAVPHEVEPSPDVLAPLSVARLLGHLYCCLVVVVKYSHWLCDPRSLQQAPNIDDLRAGARRLHVLRFRR